MAGKKQTGLGRGLSALMADVSTDAAGTGEATAPRKIDQKIPVEKIFPNPDQPRRRFTKERLDDLASSIREKGVIQPLILRDNPRKSGTYEIVAGERRWRAAQLAQLHEVPAVVREYSDSEALEVAIIENIQRADLNAIEEAAGYRDLMERFGHTQEKLAEALGKSRSHIANFVRMLGLPDDVQELVREGGLSAGHARALITAPNPSQLAKDVVSKGLSVREVERLAKAPKLKAKPKPRAPVEKDADTRMLEQDLAATLGMKVSIDHPPGGAAGRISIGYKSLEELDDLCRRLCAVIQPND